ncbi:MAG: peroxide stress protein YaaA [Holophaga sp.]|nr:peroxide stress protein YaaA [Holophaga sp.]
MILVISPAKTQDFATPPHTAVFTQPGFLTESARLVKLLRALSLDQLARLMGISEPLAVLNAARFQDWKTPFTPDNAKQAVLAFNGDVYGGLDAPSLGQGDLDFAQDHLRILSGLYGCLRPLDLIRPYRLEMKIRLANARGADLYAFWGDRLTRALKAALGSDPVLVNLASADYFKALDPGTAASRVVTPVFEDWSRGAFRVVGFHAKRARGLMCRYAIRQRLDRPEALQGFAEERYRFDPGASKGDRWVFRRQG